MKESLHSLKMSVKRGMSDSLTSQVFPVQIPLPPDEKIGWKPYPIFHGSTAILQSLSCHVSVLTRGHSPHPPHTHNEEEILLLLTGEVNLIIQDDQAIDGVRRKRMKPGQFVYYPIKLAHTIETVSEEPANYLMLKWFAEPEDFGSALPLKQHDAVSPDEKTVNADEFRTYLVFEGPTAYLRRLQCHTSTLMPNGGYDPHVDTYDVAIIVLEGEIETLGERVVPHGVVIYPAGEPHGLRNPGEMAAKYIVFEFHGNKAAPAVSFFVRLLIRFFKLIVPKRIQGKIRHLLGWLSKSL